MTEEGRLAKTSYVNGLDASWREKIYSASPNANRACATSQLAPRSLPPPPPPLAAGAVVVAAGLSVVEAILFKNLD